jgi:hypothetical protein
MKRILLSASALALWAGAALAQVNVVPSPGVTSGYVTRQTYSAIWIGLAPAASTTDIICISASSTKTVRLQSLSISGSAGTTLSLPVTVLRRATLDSGGTAASTTANPANTIGKRDTGNGTASATLISYTANPTINDTSPTYLDSAQLAISLTTMATVSIPVRFDWAKDTENLLQAPTLTLGSTQQICANLNSTSLASGLLTGSITWTEE